MLNIASHVIFATPPNVFSANQQQLLSTFVSTCCVHTCTIHVLN